MKRLLALLSCALCLWSVARPAEPVELAPDLGYLRIHSLVGERAAVTAALYNSRALVLDLRYPVDERDAGETLGQVLARQPTRPRLYVLVSPATPVPVVGAIAGTATPLVTLGLKGSRPEPEVVVEQSAQDDRRAYDALAAGMTLAQLISGKMEKERFDEATLVKEFKNGNHDAQPPAAGKVDGAAPAAGKDTAAPPTDRVLQRAVHLHRALQALKG